MSVIKLTFDGSLNTAKQDAEFNYYLTNEQNGIIKGLKEMKLGLLSLMARLLLNQDMFQFMEEEFLLRMELPLMLHKIVINMAM